MQIDSRDYLIPVDAKMQAAHRLTEGMVDMDTILAGLNDQVRTNILIFDACHNNLLEAQIASNEPNRVVAAGSGLAAPSSLGAGVTHGAGT